MSGVEKCVTRQHKLFMLEESTLWQSVQQHTSGNPRLSECKSILRIRWMVVSTRLAMEVPWAMPRVRREERDLYSERLATKAACDVQEKRREPKHDDGSCSGWRRWRWC